MSFGSPKRNAVWIQSQGGYEVGAEHYKWMVMMHVSWFLSMIVEYTMRKPYMSEGWYIWFGIFLLAQVGRYAVICDIREISGIQEFFVLPSAPKVERGNLSLHQASKLLDCKNRDICCTDDFWTSSNSNYLLSVEPYYSESEN